MRSHFALLRGWPWVSLRLTAAMIAAGVAGSQVAKSDDARDRAIHRQLDQEVALSFAGEVPLEDALLAIQSASAKARENEIKMVVDPAGLQRAGATMKSKIALDVEGVPLGMALRLVLRQVGLTYAVKDGLVAVTDVPNPKSQNVLLQLEQPIDLPFPDGATLDAVLKQIRSTSQATSEYGIPIYVDPEGLKIAGASSTSRVTINARRIPLRHALQTALAPLKLTYLVRDGLLEIMAEPSQNSPKQE